jgi:6-pyruvoyltetrahydropterin/6-carboxytetrahydropterin synthase
MKTCSKKYSDIPFAHRQWKHKGHCRFIHGHNWSFEFTFSCERDNGQGFVVDFGGLKWLKQWIEAHFDHTCVLNQDDPLVHQFHSVGGDDAWDITVVPDASCEGIAQFLYEQVNLLFKDEGNLPAEDKGRGIKVELVTVYEDSKNSATYSA